MATSSFVQTSFAGGEISQAAQGRLDLPAYKISMNVCLNGIPIETGAWLRRPGTRHVAPTRGGKAGKLIPFPFVQTFPYVMEFTDSFLRFTSGQGLVHTNDSQTVTAISAANPAAVTTALSHGWSTGNTVEFPTLSADPLLLNRQFTITVTGSTAFTLADAITGAAIDGSTLGTFGTGTVARVLEIATPFSGTSWSNLRAVLAESNSQSQAILLNGSHPQILTTETLPSVGAAATFSLAAADFIDGPYLDPYPGSICTYDKTNGNVTLTFSFQAYVSTTSYSVGDYVTSGGQGYVSLTAANAGNTPASSPTNWKPVNGGAPVGPNGFVASDVGRHIRLFSEPPLWAAGTFTTGQVVKYNDSYYKMIGTSTTSAPDSSATNWSLVTGTEYATWTWGRITSIAGAGLIAPSVAIGNMTTLSAAFNGNINQGLSTSAHVSSTVTAQQPFQLAFPYSAGAIIFFSGNFYEANRDLPLYVSGATYVGGVSVVSYIGEYWLAGASGKLGAPGNGQWTDIGNTLPTNSTVWNFVSVAPSVSVTAYAGQDFHTSAKQISSVTVFPTTDQRFGVNLLDGNFLITLRASHTSPTDLSNDGVQLGTSGFLSNFPFSISIASSDAATAYEYVWIVMSSSRTSAEITDDGSHLFTMEVAAAQIEFFSPDVSNGSVVTIQLAGAPLLYTPGTVVSTWRAGVFSDTTGWPTCGAYQEGRLWVSGSVPNRIDASQPNNITNFAPTEPTGQVIDSNAISYIFNSDDVNPIFWMMPDQQGILCGTQAGEWLISAPTPAPLSPTNIRAVRVTKIGCANVEPRRTEHTMVILQRFGRKIVEYFADVFSGKFSAPNLSERAKHLTVSGIAEIAYQQELAPIIWARRNDGGLIGATYKRDTLMTSQGPTIIGWHRHALGSGRLVESICVGPSVTGGLDTVSMVTNDPATGIRHIEIMTDLLDEGFAIADCWFLDDAIASPSTVVQAPPTGGVYGSLLVSGLTVHNGKTVSAFIAGLDCGDYTVAGGSITVPFGDGISAGTANGLFTLALLSSFTTVPAVVGFTYNSDGQLVRPVAPADTGAQSGPGFAKIGRQHRAAALLYGAVNGSITFGSDFQTLYAAKLRYPNDVPYTIQQQWSGIWRDNVNSLLDFDGMIAWRISRPLPAFVMAVGGFDSKADV